MNTDESSYLHRIRRINTEYNQLIPSYDFGNNSNVHLNSMNDFILSNTRSNVEVIFLMIILFIIDTNM